MILSKRSNGFYNVIYNQSNGKRTRISTKTKIKAEALKFLSQFQKEIETRKLQKLTCISLSDYINCFQSYSKTIHTPKTQKGYQLTLNYVKTYFGVISLNDITQLKISDYFEQRIKSSSIYQARKDLICLNSLLNKAIAEGYILQNPCRNIKRFRLPQKQPLFFSELEFDLLISKVKEIDFKDLIIFASQTGLRQMELLTLEWNQINFKDRYLILDNRNYLTKSKKIRTIPLSMKALQILTNKQLKKNCELVFTYHNKQITQTTISHRFKDYINEAKINPELNFHSLRHTFASWLVQRGVSIYEVSKLLGHSSVNVTQIYSHLRTEDLRASINLLNN
jgi:site-specific recombinase XerD